MIRTEVAVQNPEDEFETDPSRQTSRLRNSEMLLQLSSLLAPFTEEKKQLYIR